MEVGVGHTPEHGVTIPLSGIVRPSAGSSASLEVFSEEMCGEDPPATARALAGDIGVGIVTLLREPL